MSNKVALFINGESPKEFPDLTNFSKVYCTDGAYKYLIDNQIRPDVVSGDFDSVSTDYIYSETEIVVMEDQNYTDFEKALQLIKDRGYDEVYVYGSSGIEQDHFLGNLTSGLKFKEQMNIVFFDDCSFYFFADKETKLEGYKNQIISLYPFPVAKKVCTEGLQYPLKSEDLDLTKRVGTRNKAVSDKVNITFEEGNLLIFVQNKESQI